MGKLTLSLLLLTGFLGIIFTTPHHLYAQEDFEVSTNHLPGFFEKLQERLVSYTKFSKEAKADYYKYLLKKRFGELKYVIENDKIDLTETTSSRYSSYVGFIADYINSNGLNTKKEALKSTLEPQKKYLQEVTRFPANSSYWRFVRQNIDVINIFVDKLQSS